EGSIEAEQIKRNDPLNLELVHRIGQTTASGMRRLLVVLRGTCFRAKYRKQEAPWLATAELGPDDPEAPMTLSEFRSLAWPTANDTARGLGCITDYDELHKAAKRARVAM